MFLITPKASSRASPPQKDHEPPDAKEPPPASRPVAKITRARVQKACDRCRVKKIKCDGVVPCLRCSHDEVICVVSKRDPNDLKAASRDYITCLETQQKSLIKTLQQISRTTPQAINAADLKEILDTVRAHGYDFANVSEVPVTDILDEWEDEDRNANIDQAASRKRRRSNENVQKPSNGTLHNFSHSGTESLSSLSKQSSSSSSINLNYEPIKPTSSTENIQTSQWSIDDYLNQASASFSQTDSSIHQPPNYNPMPLSEYAYIPTIQPPEPNGHNWTASTAKDENIYNNFQFDPPLNQQNLEPDMWWDPTLIMNSGIHDVDSDPEIWHPSANTYKV